MISGDAINKLRRIVKFAYENSEFYRELYARAELDIQKCKLPDELPYVFPDDIVHNSLKIKSNVPLYRVCASSGTKRLPKLLFRSQLDFDKSVYNQIKLMKWCGLIESDIIGIVQPSGLWGYADLTQEASRRMNLLTVQLGNAEDEMALRLIIELGVTVLDIAPSRLYSILKLADKQQCKLEKIRIAMCSGEKLSEDFRNYVWNKYRIQIFNQYGSEETDALGGETNFGKGIHIFKDSFLYEVRKDNGDLAENGEVGTLIISSLYHQGTPLIRYHIEDKIRIISKQEGIIEVIGRNEDYILIYDSVKLHLSQVQPIFNLYLKNPSIWQIQINIVGTQTVLKVCIDEIIEKELEEKLIEELVHITIDIYELWKNRMILFCIATGGFKRSGRGKQIHLLDERKNLCYNSSRSVI